ncbi:GNAT family N-acetyltransferase [Sphaerothrix gracilis]|uniref:GNAT family N-acetyltransferase n=1 Tax=Sphaerothrix gracilis TaxID=3151835 RepID=UPI0031FD721F
MQQRVLLARGRDNQRIETRLVELAQKHLEDFEAHWHPMLQQAGAEDKFWDWVVKKRISLSSDNFEGYAIEYEGMTQGLMAIETQWHRSQIDRRYPIVYVQALASAPWNRKIIQPRPELRGVGTALLLFARQRSLELGYEGRIGLHALPGAESFYDNQNMADYGPDPEQENLTYFEYGRFQR